MHCMYICLNYRPTAMTSGEISRYFTKGTISMGNVLFFFYFAKVFHFVVFFLLQNNKKKSLNSFIASFETYRGTLSMQSNWQNWQIAYVNIHPSGVDEMRRETSRLSITVNASLSINILRRDALLLFSNQELQKGTYTGFFPGGRGGVKPY